MRRQQMALAGLMWILAAGSGACGGGGTPTQPGSGTSTSAQNYLEHLVLLMQQNSLKRQTIDWTTFRATAAEVTVPDLPANVGYVRVPAFSGTTTEATTFARDLQTVIRTADKDDLAGRIVDLRSNTGGNMWPMIAGVGPVLGEGLAGHFVEPTGFESQWGYRHGASWINDNEAQRVGNPYRLKHENPRVAVLTDTLSNSSGEATVVAFRQRPNTRSFGAATCGRSTANQAFSLSDGATLYLAVSVMADRTKTMYGNAIVPDEVIADPDAVVRRAVAWLTAGG